MINQHLQAATLTEGFVQRAIAELQQFIALRPNVREVRKALAVKLVYQGYLYEEIQKILDVSLGSITGWKQTYENDGIDGLRLNHKGRKSFLSAEQREEVRALVANKGLLGIERVRV